MILDGSYYADTIVLNEWIGVTDDKQIFRYYFKWFGGRSNFKRNSIKLGIITEDYCTPLDQTVTSIGSCKHSIAWYFSEHSLFQYNGNYANLRSIIYATQIGNNGAESANNYFLMEVNLKCNYIQWISPGIHSPTFGFSIAHLPKPFKIAISLYNVYEQSIGLGLVAVDEMDVTHVSMDDVMNDNEEDSSFHPFELQPLRTDCQVTGLFRFFFFTIYTSLSISLLRE